LKYEQYLQAKILRKTLGGGMRQVGVLCAAAHVAVRDTVGKLADDHRKAKALAGLFFSFLKILSQNCLYAV
jgi:threonine aldolase